MNGPGNALGGGTGNGLGVASVVLVEDEALFRDLLHRSLEQTGRVRVLGSYSSAAEALASTVLPSADAVLLDIDLGGEDGIELGRRLRERHARLGIVLLSNHAHLAFARGLIAANLTGWAYLLKKSVRDVHSVLRAIEGVRRGQVVLDPRLMQERPFESGRFAHLTPRQWALWTLITQGHSNAAIAGQLDLSTKWIDNAVGQLYAALGLDTHDARLNARVSAALLYARESQQANLTVLGADILGTDNGFGG